ncbi:MAG: hypothetical protein K2N21_01095 [Rikenellaceae bacterium]|nr:hypothetical protein [Rikenellaceae bacterium]
MKHLKQEFDRLPFRDTVLYALTVVCLLAAVTVIFIAVFTAPKGEIHSSVLTYFGISLGFTGSVFGISAHADAQIERIRADAARAVRSVPTPPSKKADKRRPDCDNPISFSQSHE